MLLVNNRYLLRRYSNTNAVARRFDVGLDDTCGIAGYETTRGDISRDQGSCSNDAIVSNPDARQDEGMRPDETVVADIHVTVHPVDVVVRQYGCAKRHNRIFADVEPSRIRLIQFGAEGDTTALTELHLPYSVEVLTAKSLNDFTQRFAKLS